MEKDFHNTPYRILIIDDEPVLRQLLTDYLTSVGYEVFGVGDGEDALLALLRVRPHVVLLDIRLGIKSGLDILPLVMQNDPKVPVIMISCVTEQAIGREALRRGAVDYFVKPINLQHLSQSIKHKLTVYTVKPSE